MQQTEIPAKIYILFKKYVIYINDRSLSFDSAASEMYACIIWQQWVHLQTSKVNFLMEKIMLIYF